MSLNTVRLHNSKYNHNSKISNCKIFFPLQKMHFKISPISVIKNCYTVGQQNRERKIYIVIQRVSGNSHHAFQLTKLYKPLIYKHGRISTL